MKSSSHKTVQIAILSTAIAISCAAIPINIEDAGIAARLHLDSYRQFARAEIGLAPWSGQGFRIVGIEPLVNGNSGKKFAFVATLEPSGFIALSADSDIRPVIAFSFKNNFDFERSPRNVLLDILELDMLNRLQAIPTTESPVIKNNNALWKQYLARDKGLIESLSTTSVHGPWLDSNWNQGSPFNNYCPIDPETDERSVVGCVATAPG